MKQIIPILLLCFVIAGCKKSSTSEEEEYYTINGIVLDYDNQLPVSAAKVKATVIYACVSPPFPCFPEDSALSDASGRVSFRVKKSLPEVGLSSEKNSYLWPHAASAYWRWPDKRDRTDTVFMARTSFLNLTIHKSGIYQPQDTIRIYVTGDYLSATYFNQIGRLLYENNVNLPDRIVNLYTWYNAPGYTKLYFNWEVRRNGNMIVYKSDSANLIQFGSQNFSINY